METKNGKLYIVSTPIGNLGDITLRAIRILKEVGIVAAEDTRHTRHLLNHYQISSMLTSYHDFNKEEKAEILLQKMKEGTDVALVSDAGTPGISDPGYLLIKRSIEEGIGIVSIPGPSSPMAALSISGLPTDAFIFEGFLPRKKGQRTKRIEALKDDKRTLILFESPYRIRKTLEELVSTMGDRRVALVREITKVYEEVIRGAISEVKKRLGDKRIRGEITLVIEGNLPAGRKDG